LLFLCYQIFLFRVGLIPSFLNADFLNNDSLRLENYIEGKKWWLRILLDVRELVIYLRKRHKTIIPEANANIL
jgi:hypothetical protein